MNTVDKSRPPSRAVRWLAYGSDESGAMEIYVRPFPATGSAKWQVSTAGGIMPVWSRSGRRLYYLNGKNEIVAADIDRLRRQLLRRFLAPLLGILDEVFGKDVLPSATHRRRD